MFRNLRADEIELRVGTATANGFSLLLYKDARCDMNILDETVGAMNWKRSHSRENANCTVSLWDAEKKEWVSKEDTGAESFTEKEKGLASDSFKRACVNWGIGRELYTAPFIWIKGHTQPNNGRYKTDGFDRDLKVSVIEYDENNNISNLVITGKSSEVVWKYGEKQIFFKTEPNRGELIIQIQNAIRANELDHDKVLKKAKTGSLEDMPTERLVGMLNWITSLDESKRKELK